MFWLEVFKKQHFFTQKIDPCNYFVNEKVTIYDIPQCIQYVLPTFWDQCTRSEIFVFVPYVLFSDLCGQVDFCQLTDMHIRRMMCLSSAVMEVEDLLLGAIDKEE